MPTVLAIAQETCDLIGLPRPSSLIGSTDQNARQLLALLREELEELHDAEWQRPTREWTFTATASEVQTDAIPVAMRSFVTGSFFNRTTGQPIIGPLSSQKWMALKARPQTGASVWLTWIQRDDAFVIYPTPSGGDTIAYEYITDAKVINGPTGLERIDIESDSDVPLLNNKLIQLGLRWRFLKAKLLDYGEDLATYERRKGVLFAQDGGAPILRLGSVDCRRSGPFVYGMSIGLSDSGLQLEDGSNLLLEPSAPT